MASISTGRGLGGATTSTAWPVTSSMKVSEIGQYQRRRTTHPFNAGVDVDRPPEGLAKGCLDLGPA